MTETPIAFSFLKLNNLAKGILKPHNPDECDPNWIEKTADKRSKQAWLEYNRELKKKGVSAPKVKYPVKFGKGDNQYFGLMAMEDIEKNEIIIKVPSNLIINTKKAFYCTELRDIFYHNPQVFGKHTPDGEDNVFHTFVLLEIQKKEKSQYYQMIKMWPKDTDILMNWNEEDLEWLQDPTLSQEAQKQYNTLMHTWNRLYKCLRKYPEMFKPETIAFNKFKWFYILTMNRCFASNWPTVSQMVPFADQLNHENVNVAYDCHDPVTGKTCISIDEKKAREADQRVKNKEEQSKYLEDLATDLTNIAEDLDSKDKDKGADKMSQLQLYKDIDENNVWRIKTKNYLSKLQQDQIDDNCEDIKGILSERRKKLEKIKNQEDGLSSGLESDNDLDLLVEQEVMRAVKLRKQYKQALRRQQIEDEKKERQQIKDQNEQDGKVQDQDDNDDSDDDSDDDRDYPGKNSIHKPSKDQVFDLYDKCFQDVPDEYNFVIQSNTDRFPKGSQLYLCYGRMSNRDALKRYGFGLTFNKYNHMTIKLRLEQNDPDFRYRHYVIQKFFSCDSKDKSADSDFDIANAPTYEENELLQLNQKQEESNQNAIANLGEFSQLDVQSRHFRIYYQRLNTKVLKFIKILTYNVHEDDLQCIVETRSLSLEYLSFKKLQGVYERFLETFPTTLAQDLETLRGPKCKDLTVRQYFGVLYRSEQKRILVNQVKLVKVTLHILERLMKGLTFDFAVTRVFDLESKQDFIINRKMLDNYLTSLKNGLQKNKETYLKIHNLTEEQMQALDAATLDKGFNNRRMRPTEVKGYEQMISRMLDAPLESSERNKNYTLQQKLLKIKDQIGQKGGYMPAIPNMVEYEAASTASAEARDKEVQDKGQGKKGLSNFMQAQHSHLENLKKQMERKLLGETEPEEEDQNDGDEKKKKLDEGEESSSGEYTYGSEEGEESEQEEGDKLPKNKKDDGADAQPKAPKDMTDSEILHKIQQQQVKEFYSTAKGSFLSDLDYLNEIKDRLSKEINTDV